MPVPQDLLDILACPQCKTPVVLADERLVCCNEECRRSYEVRDDIPIMLIEEAKILEVDEWNKIMAAHAPSGEAKAAAGESKNDEG